MAVIIRDEAHKPWCLVLFMLVAVGSGPAVGQGGPVVPVLPVSSPDDLRSALDGVPTMYQSELRYALIATQPRSLVAELHALVLDPGENLRIRTNAVMVLPFRMDRLSVSILRDLAGAAGPLQVHALAALQFFPYPEACDFWRDALRRPDAIPLAATFAPSGISFCGDEGDIRLLDSVATSLSPGRRSSIARVYRPRLQQAMSERYRSTFFEGNFPPSGRYAPPPALLARLVAVLCGETCPPGHVASADGVRRLQEHERRQR